MSDWQQYLSERQLGQVREAIVTAGLCTERMLQVFLGGMLPQFTASLPTELAPADQLQVQLSTMNTVANLGNGDVPLAQYLQNVIEVLGDRPQANVLDRALMRVIGAPLDPPATMETMSMRSLGPADDVNFDVMPEAMIVGNDSTLPVSYLQQALNCTTSVFKLLVHRHLDGEPEYAAGDTKRLISGTGWMIGPNLLITNHHVINARMKGFVNEPDASEEDFLLQAANTEILFDYLIQDQPSHTVSSGEGALVASDRELDFAILRIPDTAPKRSPLKLRTRSIKKRPEQMLGLRVNLLQHPNGAPMRLGFRDNFVVLGDNSILSYLTDTSVGSSGSPVSDDRWSVAALHAGSRSIGEQNIVIRGKKVKRENFGIPIPTIMEKLKTGFPALHAEIESAQQEI